MIDILYFLVSILITLGACAIVYYWPANPIKPKSINYLKYVAEPYPEASFRYLPRYISPSIYTWVVFFIIIFPLIWMLINVEAVFSISLVYLIIYSIAIPMIWLDYLHPQKIKAIGQVAWGGRERDEQFFVGLVIGVAAIAVMYVMTFSKLQATEVFKPLLLSFFFTVGVAPLVEERVFGNILVSSLSQFLGWLPAITISGVAFAILHWAAYQASVSMMLYAFFFRIMAGFALVKWVSWLPGLVGHSVCNLLSFIYNIQS